MSGYDDGHGGPQYVYRGCVFALAWFALWIVLGVLVWLVLS